MRYLLAIDQGTTGTRAILFSEALELLFASYMEHTQISAKPGWTEHDPEEILSNTKTVIGNVLREAENAGIRPEEIAGMGLANQGETCLAWDAVTGKPLANAVVWHCTRSEDVAERLRAIPDFDDYVNRTTGLRIDSYFSATKFLWLRENVPAVKEAEEAGRVRYGTLDSWLISMLTGGKSFFTDVSTASRTMLLNIHTLAWDEKILETLAIPESALPEVLPNAADFGTAAFSTEENEYAIPILSSIVDQQGALFGQCCFEKGMLKATYGTGCFALMNAGDSPVFSDHGLMTSVGWNVCGNVSYVLDAAIYMCGAVMQWLKNKLGVIEEYSDIDRYALGIPDNGGVYFVTAFSGLSAPIWDASARGTIVGLTTNSTKSHVIRAAVESVAYQVCDVIRCLEMDTGITVRELKVDGGLTKSSFLTQFQSDVLNLPVVLMQTPEATAQGVAMIAGLKAGIFRDFAHLQSLMHIKKTVLPACAEEERSALIERWHKAEETARTWTP